ALTERAQTAREHVKRFTADVSNHRHRWLLRARRERPRGRAADQRDEVAASHVEHRGSLPHWRCQSVYRTLNLPQRGREVLGGQPELFCSGFEDGDVQVVPMISALL